MGNHICAMDINTFYNRAYSWILTFGPRIVLAVVVLVAGQWLIGVFRKCLTSTLDKRRMDMSLKPFLLSLLSTLMQVLLIFGVLQILGIQMTIFAALIGGI